MYKPRYGVRRPRADLVGSCYKLPLILPAVLTMKIDRSRLLVASSDHYHYLDSLDNSLSTSNLEHDLPVHFPDGWGLSVKF